MHTNTEFRPNNICDRRFGELYRIRCVHLNFGSKFLVAFGFAFSFGFGSRLVALYRFIYYIQNKGSPNIMYTYVWFCDTIYKKQPRTHAVKSYKRLIKYQIIMNVLYAAKPHSHTHICIPNLWMSIFIGKIIVEQCYTDEYKFIFSNYHNSTRNKTTNCLYSNEYVSKPNQMWIEWACENGIEMKMNGEKIMNFGLIDKSRTHFRHIKRTPTFSFCGTPKCFSIIQLYI